MAVAAIDAQAVLVYDSTCFIHAGRGDVLWLLETVAGALGQRHLVPSLVAREVARHGQAVPDSFDLVEENPLQLTRWRAQMGAEGLHHLGESAVCAVAESQSGVAVIDDKDARLVAGRQRLPVHGLLWLVSAAVNASVVDETSATSFCNVMLSTGVRWRFRPDGFSEWARERGLLS